MTTTNKTLNSINYEQIADSTTGKASLAFVCQVSGAALAQNFIVEWVSSATQPEPSLVGHPVVSNDGTGAAFLPIDKALVTKLWARVKSAQNQAVVKAILTTNVELFGS